MQAFYKIFSLLSCMALALVGPQAVAVSLIRDAEIENTLRVYGNPIFEAAGLNPQAIHIFIVQDSTINAYVAGGANMFIHTGLLLKTDRPGMLLGVMAHETGHMSGGHLAQGAEKLKNAELGTIFTMLLGAAAAVSGQGQAGVGVMSAGGELAMRNYLHFTRANENAADQAGLDYLDQLKISAAGMLRMLEILRQDENRSYGNPDPYTRTHPLSIDRISHIRDHVLQSAIPQDTIPSGFAERHARMLAKLHGFLDPSEDTLRLYPPSDISLSARYARAVAYYRIPDLPKSLAELDSLIKEKPNDPFFYELRGQILFENGRIQEAAQAYAKAVVLLPSSSLILADYGKVLTAHENKADIAKAVQMLERATVLDNSNADTWHHLAIAYGKQGKQGMFYLASAEAASLQDKPKEVLRDVELALKNLGPDSPARLRANDLKLIAEKQKQEKKDDK